MLIPMVLAQNLRIRLYDGVATKELQCVVGTGEYLLEIHQSDGVIKSYLLPTFAQGRIKVNNSNLQFFQGANLLGQGIKITLIQGAKEDFINWSVPLVSSKVRAYESDFELTVVKGQIQVINHVDLDTYLEGVVSSEGGSGHQKAYYQAQAIISRTYALAYQNRHQKEGYALCDRVHCQAYLHKRSGSALIDSAVYQTHQMVLKDASGKYFPTFFSANCGGQTCPPQDVWNEPISGLHSFVDTFCIHTKQATWQKRIPLTTWLDFLTANYDFPIADSTAMALLQDFQSINRSAFYLHPVYGIPMRDLRQEFKLKSSFFNVVVSGQEVVLSGKGFGHGVGLCQEGAMQMAKKGYNATQILEFYYPGAVVVKDAHSPTKE
jgi:stage II sporulation protein D